MNINLFKRGSSFKFQEENEGYYLYDGCGYVLDKESTKELITKLQNAVDNMDWDEVDKHNVETEIKHIKEIEEYKEEILKNSIPKRDRKKKKGVIYFIKNDSNMVKIGLTVNTKARFGEYTKLPFEPIVLNLVDSEDVATDEEKYHDMFKHKRKRGEWFELSEEDIEFIKNIR